jgi:enoyl-CoA hydratase/carnithine racemase
MSDVVDIDIRGRVMAISMRRENKRNAVDRALADGIDAALNRLEDDVELWVGILTSPDSLQRRHRSGGRRRQQD